MTSTDPRAAWEIEWCLRYNHCATYLDISQATGTAHGFLSTVYGDLDAFAQQHIKTALDGCGKMVEQNGQPSSVAVERIVDTQRRLLSVAAI